VYRPIFLESYAQGDTIKLTRFCELLTAVAILSAQVGEGGALASYAAVVRRRCYENTYKTRLHLFTMRHAHLCEIRKFLSKNLVHRGIDFHVQNALKHLRTHLHFQKIRGRYSLSITRPH